MNEPSLCIEKPTDHLISVSSGLFALLHIKLAYSFPTECDRGNQPGKAVQ